MHDQGDEIVDALDRFRLLIGQPVHRAWGKLPWGLSGTTWKSTGSTERWQSWSG